LDTDSFLLVTKPPYGVGREIFRICLYDNCLDDLTAPLEIPIGPPGISPDRHFAIAFSEIDLTALVLFNLLQRQSYEVFHVQFDYINYSPLVWSDNGQEVYALGANYNRLNTEVGIYKLTFEGQTLIAQQQLVEIDDDLAYSTALWLVDPVNQLSIHALRNGGLNIVCWDITSA
ncbi:MAG: hypothetical protein ABI835_15315, partial [Chloroflexota bacterium]